jgi:hypothetical protein
MARGEKFWGKVLAAVDRGEPQRVVAERFGVSVSAVRYWVAQRRRAGAPEILPVRVAARSNGGLELEVGGVVARLSVTAASTPSRKGYSSLAKTGSCEGDTPRSSGNG